MSILDELKAGIEIVGLVCEAGIELQKTESTPRPEGSAGDFLSACVGKLTMYKQIKLSSCTFGRRIFNCVTNFVLPRYIN